MSKTMSFKLDEDLFYLEIKHISKILNSFCSEFVINAIKKEVEVKKDDFMVRMANVPYCDEEEENPL